MVVGIIVGASIFVQPSEINRHVPTVPGVLSVWIAAGILTLFGALVCARLSAAFPRTGGVYVFLKETLSPAFGFLWGWAMFWSAHSGIIAASSVLFAFGGWHMVTYTAGETRDPVRTIPRALLIGTLTVTTIYVLLNAAYLYL